MKMEIFREKGNEESDISIEIKLCRNIEKSLSTWEISNFIATFSSNYYKEELINTIGLALKEGIKPENIFIMEQSFSLNNSYSRVGIMDLVCNNDIKTFYYLGNPVSMYPNKDLYIISLVFKMFRKANELLYSKLHIRISRDILIECILNLQNNNSLKNILKSITNTTITLAEKTTKNKEYRLEIKDKVIKNERNILQQYNNFEKSEPQLTMIEKIIRSDNELEVLEEKVYSSLEKMYYDRFYKLLTNLSRPIVGIYYKEENKVQILCASHINKEKRNKRFLHMRSLSHNSPVSIVLVAGFTILLTAAVGIKASTLKRRKRRVIKATEKIKEDTKKIKQEVLDVINTFEKNEELKAVDDLENPYVRKRLVYIRKMNRLKGKSNLDRYKFEVEDSQIAK